MGHSDIGTQPALDRWESEGCLGKAGTQFSAWVPEDTWDTRAGQDWAEQTCPQSLMTLRKTTESQQEKGVPGIPPLPESLPTHHTLADLGTDYASSTPAEE